MPILSDDQRNLCIQLCTLVSQYRYLPRVIKATNNNFVNFIWICFAECVRQSYVDVATSHDVKLQLISSRYQPHSVIVIPLGCVYRIHGLCHLKKKDEIKGNNMLLYHNNC